MCLIPLRWALPTNQGTTLSTFRLFAHLLWEEVPEAGTGFCSNGDFSQAKSGDSLSERQLPLQRAPQACPADGQFIWIPRLEKWTREGCGYVCYARKWDMIRAFHGIYHYARQVPAALVIGRVNPSLLCAWSSPLRTIQPRAWFWLSQECPLGAVMSSDSTASWAKPMWVNGLTVWPWR